MADRLVRYRKVVALADSPTPLHRAIAAVIAGALAFLLTYMLLGVWWGAGAAAAAAAVAAVTMKPVRAVVYGVIGAIWLVIEAVAATIALIAAACA